MRSSATALGVDIGGTNLRVARVSQGGEVLAWRAERIDRTDRAAVLARIVALARALCDDSVVAAGVGVPGRVDARRRAVLSGGYLDLTGMDLAERIEAATGLPTVLDNDGNMALVAEMAAGAARGHENAAMLTIGTGIGGAVVSEGRILRGRASAGQLGHLTVERDGLPCVCGRRGCVETTSSGTALGRLIADAGLPAGTDTDTLLRAQAAGDVTADAILTRWAAPLRDAIDSLVAALDPEVVVLGGGLGAAAHRALERIPPPAPWYRCAVVPARLGDDAGVIGGALSALTEHWAGAGPAPRRAAVP